MTWRPAATAACLLLCGCAPGVIQSAPTLRGLDEGKVFVDRRKDATDWDVYTVTYVAAVPPEAAWEAADTVSEWLSAAALIDTVTPLPNAGSPDDESKERLEILWSDGTRQRLQLQRIEAKGLIDLQVDPIDVAAGDMAHVTVQMGPYRRDSTLVEAEVRVANNFSRRMLNFVLLPIGLIGRGETDAHIGRFFEELANRHRAASLEVLAHRGPVTGRTHIVAIGVGPRDPSGRWSAIEYAETDAREFYDWAIREYPSAMDDTVIRELVVGPAASDNSVNHVLKRLRNKEGISVRPGDTIIFYFAGHIDTEEDLLQPEQFNYLVTANAEHGNLRVTAIKKDEVLGALRYSAASQCLFICDACYSGGQRKGWSEYRNQPAARLRGSVPRERFLPPEPPGAKLAILAAASAHDTAIERDDLGHGVFTHAVLAGLRGNADADRDDYVSLAELQAFVMSEVLTLTEQKQTPFFQCPEGVDLRWKVMQP